MSGLVFFSGVVVVRWTVVSPGVVVGLSFDIALCSFDVGFNVLQFSFSLL